MSSRSLAEKVSNVLFPDLAACGQPGPPGSLPFPFFLAVDSASCPLLSAFTGIPFLPSCVVVKSQDLWSEELGSNPRSALPSVCDLCVVLSLGFPLCKGEVSIVSPS